MKEGDKVKIKDKKGNSKEGVFIKEYDKYYLFRFGKSRECLSKIAIELGEIKIKVV